CADYPDRLLPVAHISLLDVKEGVKELKRTADLGMKGAYPPVVPFNGPPYGEPHYDPFWAEAQEMGIPVSLHVTGNVNGAGGNLYPKSYVSPFWWFLVTDMGDVLMAFTSLFQGGLFERFPTLKLVVVETGAGWLPYWLDRMDSLFNKVGFTTPMKMRPSEYFRRQCWIVLDPDESTAAHTVEFVGQDRFLWGSDYPHTEGDVGALGELKENIRSLSDEARDMILGANAIELYGLG
ncbi:MAG: amidohydrolase family protein, partial [Chloroflexi bacterium]|nr:amidohydrolase family protein [Chloroflexota bacterium]